MMQPTALGQALGFIVAVCVAAILVAGTIRFIGWAVFGTC